MRRVGLLLVGVGVLLAVIMGLVVGISLKDRADRADWPSTTGVVVDLVGVGSADDGDYQSAEVVSYTVDEQSVRHEALLSEWR